MSDRNDRSSRLARRLGDEPDESASDESDDTEDAGDAPGTTGDPEAGAGAEAEESSASSSSAESSNPSKTVKSDMPAEPAKSGRASVKDRPSVLMYLPEDLRQEMDIRFDEVNAAAKREHGRGVEKNRHWYPLIVSLGLETAGEMDDDELLTRLDESEY